MLHLKRTLILVYSIILFWNISAQTTDFEITYQVDISHEKTNPDLKEVGTVSNIPEATTQPYIIALKYNNSFTLNSRSGKSVTLYDFDNEMMTSYSDDSIFSSIPIFYMIDFHVAEYSNRIFLAEMMQNSGIAKNGIFGSFANLESIFGFEVPENKIRDSILTQQNKSSVIYSFNDEELAKIRFSKNKIPKEYKESFFKFMTYRLELHPSIVEKISKQEFIPEYLEFKILNSGVATKKIFQLKNTQEITSKKIDWGSKSFKVRKSSPVRGIIDSMMAFTSNNTIASPVLDSYVDNAKRLANQNQRASALLCLFEYLLASGEDVSPQIREIITTEERDTIFDALLYCLNQPQSADEAKQKLEMLDILISLNMEYGYIMNIFAANMMQPMDAYAAIDYFEKALIGNPNITGAWNDLGKIYAERYQHEEAWKCFEILLRLNPNHSMAKDVYDRKENLKSNYPHFFKQ